MCAGDGGHGSRRGSRRGVGKLRAWRIGQEAGAAGQAARRGIDKGFTAVKHQREVGTGYFDAVTQAIQQGQSSTTALKGSTEEEQFQDRNAA